MAVLFFTGFEWGAKDKDYAHELHGNYYVDAMDNSLVSFIDNELKYGKSGNYDLKVGLQNDIGESGGMIKFSSRTEIYGQFYLQNFNFSEGYLTEFYYNDFVLYTFYIESCNNRISVRESRKGNIIGKTDVPITRDYNCIEFHLKLDSIDGIFEIKINNVLKVISTGDVNPAGGGSINGLRLGSRKNNDGFCFFDNVVIYDITGTKNNSWVNGAKVILLKPNAAGTYTQWTPYSGNNYNNVNTLPPNTNYVKAATTGLKDSYKLEDLNSKYKRIIAIKPEFVGKRGQDDVKNVIPFIITNGQRHSFTSKNVPFISKYVPGEIIETNPITTNDFTLNEINNMEIGIESKT